MGHVDDSDAAHAGALFHPPAPERLRRCPPALAGRTHSPAQPEVVSEPELVEVSEHQANLVLDLSSSTREVLRVTIRLNGKVAVDVRTPSVPAECVHPPIYSHAFRLDSDTVRVTVSTDRDQRRSITLPLDGPTQWVAVQPQDGFPIGLDVFNQEPAWG